MITSPQTGEVRALVGGRRLGFEGFNRALDARRQIGSLIKPAVYLAALESGRYTLASRSTTSRSRCELTNGETWAPRNFDDQAHGQVPLSARSRSRSTWRPCGSVSTWVSSRAPRCCSGSACAEKPRLYPSLLLGALELTPLEVTQFYNTLANGGFRVPLRAVRVGRRARAAAAAALPDRDRAGCGSRTPCTRSIRRSCR